MRVRTEAKRQAILKIAGAKFLEQGYGAVSMASVSAELGGSKTTLYGYFPSKEELFAAFVIDAGDGAFEELAHVTITGGAMDATLQTLGLSYLHLLFSPEIFAINRMVIAEVPRFPELGALFYENGPKRIIDQMSALLREADEAGLIHDMPDPVTAALHFKALCETGLYERILWGIDARISDDELRRSVHLAVEVFLSHYG
jgi:TetR/AcrR family transcriptional regulator, mexJK operon transcriptional repressor